MYKVWLPLSPYTGVTDYTEIETFKDPPTIPATSYLDFPAQVPDILVWKEALVITPSLQDYKCMREFMQESLS